MIYRIILIIIINLEKSYLSNSKMKNNKNIVMPQILNLNINENKLFATLEDTSNLKKIFKNANNKRWKKNDLSKANNSNNNSNGNSTNNNRNNEKINKINNNNINKKEKEKNVNNKINNEDYVEEEEDDEDLDLDIIFSANNDLIINKKYLFSSSTNNDNSLKKIKVLN